VIGHHRSCEGRKSRQKQEPDGKREGACACETNNEREEGVKEVRDLVDEIRRHPNPLINSHSVEDERTRKLKTVNKRDLAYCSWASLV
jgi:hypothetical protein